MLVCKNRFRLVFAGLLCVTLVSLATPGFAGPLSLTDLAYNDGFGPASGAWKGTATFSGGLGFSATVDYAVFAPGTFGDFLTEQGIGFADPTDQSQLVYAYQVNYNAASFGAISSNTVGLDGDETIGMVGSIPKALVAGANYDPSNGANQGTSVGWDYFSGSTAIFSGPPKKSTILFFTSPDVPEYDYASLLHLGGPAPQLVASPSNVPYVVPEPACLTLLLIGSISGIQLIRRRTAR
jgi:hypothetical protein